MLELIRKGKRANFQKEEADSKLKSPALEEKSDRALTKQHNEVLDVKTDSFEKRLERPADKYGSASVEDQEDDEAEYI